AQREATAIAETCYHRERFMRATRQPRCELDMRVLSVMVSARLHDLRGLRAALPAVYHLESYAESQVLGGALRAGGSNGIVYDSVRHEGGVCAARFARGCCRSAAIANTCATSGTARGSPTCWRSSGSAFPGLERYDAVDLPGANRARGAVGDKITIGRRPIRGTGA